jgi:hypothetical protein
MKREPETDPDRIRNQRNLVMALLLGSFVVLVFAISIVKMKIGG